MITALALIAAAAASPLTPTPVTSYQVRVTSPGDAGRVETYSGPNLGRVRFLAADADVVVRRADTEYAKGARGLGGLVTRNFPRVEPDGYPLAPDQWTETIAHILGRARSGEPVLVVDTLGTVPAFKTTLSAVANECAGFPPSTITVWLSQQYLLPLRAERRAQVGGALLDSSEYRYTKINGTFPASLFAPPRVAGPGMAIQNHRFTRMSARAAAGPLPYVPREPGVMITGFRQVVSGWAPRGELTGPEASIPRLPWLYAASWRRGQEHIDFTMRVSKRDWLADPFGHECQEVSQEPVTIGTGTGFFGTGPSSTPHLYWRDGSLLYTLSGPLPKEQLLQVAASLRKVPLS